MLPARLAVKGIFFVNGFIHASWVSRLPRIQDRFGIDNGTLGTALLFISVGAIVAMPFTGGIISRVGSRMTTLMAITAFTLLVPFIPLLPSLPYLLLLFLLLGVTSGITDVAMNAQAVLVEKQMAIPIMTSFHGLWSIGMALGAACGSLFSYLDTTLLIHLGVSAALGMTVILTSRGYLIHEERTPSASGESFFRLPTPALATVGVIAFCCMLGEGAMADWSTNFMEKVAHTNPGQAPWGLAAFALAMTAGRAFGDGLRVRWGDRKLLVVSSLLASAGISILVVAPHVWISIGAFFAVGLGLSVIVPITYSIAGRSREVNQGVGIAMVATIGYSGFLIGPPCIGYLADWIGLRWAIGIVLSLFILMTVLSLNRKEASASA